MSEDHQHKSGLAPEAVVSAWRAEGLVVAAVVQPRQRRQRVASVAVQLRRYGMVAEGVVSSSPQ